MKRPLAAVLVLSLAGWAGAACAEVWGFVDDHGAAHFASEKLDGRHVLFCRGGEVMPATAQRYGVHADRKATVDAKLADPATNFPAGSRYLRDLLDPYPGNVERALAAYIAGQGAVQRAGHRILNYRGAQNYVKTVLQLYAMLKPPSMAAPTSAPARVRMELAGGAAGRGNLPADAARGGNSAAADAAPVVTAGALD